MSKPDDVNQGRSTWTKSELAFDEPYAAYQRGLALLTNQPDRVAELTFLGHQR